MDDNKHCISYLTEKEKCKVLASVNRVKEQTILTNDVQWAIVTFRPDGSMTFSESHRMVIVK